MRVIALLLAQFLAVGCAPGTDGFEIWVTNDSGQDVYVAFRGESSTDVEHLSSVTYQVPAAATNLASPFILVDDSLTGSVLIFDSTCNLLADQRVETRDYGVTIGVDLSVSIREFGFLGRPTTQEQMTSSDMCVPWAERRPTHPMRTAG